MFIIQKRKTSFIEKKQNSSEIQFWLIEAGRHCKVNIQSTMLWRHPTWNCIVCQLCDL